MRYLYILMGLLSFSGVIWAQETLRLTDRVSEKPSIVVNATGSHVVWMEVQEEPAPVNRTYLVIVYDVKTKVKTEVLRVPGIRSNAKMQVLVGEKLLIKGPHFKSTDLNYRIVGDNIHVRLSSDGRYLATCVEENYNTTLRTPLFVIIDLKEKNFELIPVHIPEGLGTITGHQITSQMDLRHWDFSPDGKYLAYVLNAVNYRGSALVLYDVQKKSSQRLLGYQTAAYVNGSLTLEGPADQLILFGHQLYLGLNSLVISGKNSQGREGFWMVSLPQGRSLWHEAAYAKPGVAGNHVFYSSQKPAVWLNADGTEHRVFEQLPEIINHAAWPFWSDKGSAYVTNQSFSTVFELGNEKPTPVINKTNIDMPETWQFQFMTSSSADSYRLVSDTGNTLVLPVCDPANNRMLDLFLMTLSTPESITVPLQEDSTNSFNSLIDAFEVKSLLKPGELSGQFMPKDRGIPAKRMSVPPLPVPWQAEKFPIPEPYDVTLHDTAQSAYDGAQMQLMLGKLNDTTLERVIEQLEKAVELEPDNRQYRMDLADAYVIANTMISVGAGIEQYYLLLKDNKRDDEALAGLADAYMQLGNVDQAMEIVYLRIVQNPDDVKVRHSAVLQMSALALESGDHISGLTWLRQVYRQHPNDTFIQGLIGLIWELQGESRRAEAIFDRILKQADTNDPVYETIRRIKQALVAGRRQS